jgi:uncharacterized cupredoxin-like copper-binding protein
MFRRITFRALPALISAALLFVVGSAAATAATAHKASATTVKVSAIDFKFKLSATSLKKPGTVTFKVTNNGHTQHDFSIDKKTTKLLSPGKSATLTVTLKKGTYYYECTVPGHAALGMKGNFKVA